MSRSRQPHSETEQQVSETDESNEHVGEEFERVEDERLLTGKAEFVHDISPENVKHMALLRTTHPHAEIVDIDVEAAEAHPECDLVLTGEDIAAEYNPMPCGLEGIKEWALAKDKVTFVGEPIALVIANNRYVAEDILDLISVEYEQLSPVIDSVDARDDSPVIHESIGTNVPDSEDFQFGDVESAFAEADVIVEDQYSWGRISGVPLETSGVVAEYDPQKDEFHIDSNIQLHTLVDDTVYETLGYDPDDVTLNVPKDVGGSFGTKIALHRYCSLAAMASQQLNGIPIKYNEDRIENLQGGDMHSSDREYFIRIAANNDGTIQGLSINFVDDFGSYPRYPVNQTLKPLSVLTNTYQIEDVRYNYEIVLTNKTSQTAYRGFGVNPHIYAIEMIIDKAARELNVDPYEFRMQNLIQPDSMPYQLPSGNIYDSGDFPDALESIKEIVEEKEQTSGGLLDPEIVERQREEGKYRGVAYTVHVEPGVSGSDWTNRQRTDKHELEERTRADVDELPEYLYADLETDGTITAYLATDSSGQGHQTLVTQLLADELSISPKQINVSYLDSVEAPTEYGSAASRMGVMLSGAAQELGKELISQFKRVAASHLDANEDDLVYDSGTITDSKTKGSITIAELATTDENDRLTNIEAAYDHPATDIDAFNEPLTTKKPVYPTAAFAANAPIVEVDIETGFVDILKIYSLRDCGTQLNPMIVEGQAMGGLAQGIGAALTEEFPYDESGQPKAITLFDYKLPTTKNIPDIELHHTETPSPFTVNGAKGTGEGGMIDGPASIAASVNRALADFDIITDTIPATPNRIYESIQNSEL